MPNTLKVRHFDNQAPAISGHERSEAQPTWSSKWLKLFDIPLLDYTGRTSDMTLKNCRT